MTRGAGCVNSRGCNPWNPGAASDMGRRNEMDECKRAMIRDVFWAVLAICALILAHRVGYL